MPASEALHEKFQRNLVFRITVRLASGPDALEGVLTNIHGIGARVGGIDQPGPSEAETLFDLDVFAVDDAQMDQVRAALADLDGCEVLAAIDLAMETHRGGACEVRSRTPIESNTDLRIVYTPGVARVCKAIEADPSLARQYTNIPNRVAIATNGTAILGLGDIGPVAGLPVMEGKAAIFWEFVGLSADPVLFDTHDADEFIHVMERIACGYGAVQIEDVAAPECFKITRELDERLDMPVLHDDQHGTATIVLAGLYSALAKVGRDIKDVRCAISGAGAGGTAVADLLLTAGMADVALCDSRGIVSRARDALNDEKRALAERTNKDNLSGTLTDAMAGRDLLIGLSKPGIVSGQMVQGMAADPIVLALANPVSEIRRDDALAAGASIYADGRMMNNALAYPGIFRGAMDAQATRITLEMLMAAAHALADCVTEGNLMPEMMDPNTHQAVVAAVAAAAKQ